jgi:uncharacterized protein YraI
MGLLALAMPALAQQSDRAFGGATLRAGPSHQYPQVATLSRGDGLQVHGCIADWSWCDVRWQQQRGWISAAMIEFDTRDDGSTVATAVPTIDFSLDPYWDAHYRTRPWSRERVRWRGVPMPAETPLPSPLARQLAPPQLQWTPALPAEPSGAWAPPPWIPPGERMDRELPPPDALNPKRHPEWHENTAGPVAWSPLHPAEVKLIEEEAKKRREQEAKEKAAKEQKP